MSRSTVRLVAFGALLAFSAQVACGDVTSDLITDASGGSALGGSSSGGSTSGGSATGGSATGGSTTGGAETGGSSSGSSSGGSDSAGSSSGGSNSAGSSSGGDAGSSGTPMCATSDDCSGSERNICRVSDGVCVECTGSDVPCDPDENCSEHIGECARPCANDDACVGDDDSHCYTAINFCVECLDDLDCQPDERCGNYQCNEP